MATPIRYIKSARDDLKNVRHVDDLCSLLGIDALRLHIMAKHPRYKVFKLRKSDGSFRTIEDPEPKLKAVLRNLNDLLQAVYYFIRPDCVQGFTISAPSDEPRNIVSNAQKHAGNPYMLNLDLKDFFHQIRKERVEDILKIIMNKSCDCNLISLLSSLMVYKNRLPMGSPTSPVLSNFTLLDTDHEMMNLCRMYNITFTRYADDLSFSSTKRIEPSFRHIIEDILFYKGFQVNPAKIKWYGPDDDKVVTGIIVGEDVLSLPMDYFDKLRHEVELYKNTLITDMLYQTGMSPKKLDLFRQEIAGKINFAKMVCPGLNTLQEIEQIFEEEIPIDEISRSWLDIPYSF